MASFLSLVQLFIWHTLFCGPVAVVLPLIWALIHLLGCYPRCALQFLHASWFGLYPVNRRLERSRDVLQRVWPDRSCLLELYWAALWWPVSIASFFILLAMSIVSGVMAGIFGCKWGKSLEDNWDYYWGVHTFLVLVLFPNLGNVSMFMFSPCFAGLGYGARIHCRPP